MAVPGDSLGRKRKDYFIQDAIKRPGALSRKAKRSHMTVNQYARTHQHDKGVTGSQSRFYLNVLKR